MNKVELTWDEFKDCCRELADRIKNKYSDPDSKTAIVGINRGGMIPAVVIAKMLRMEVIPWTPKKYIQYSEIRDYDVLIFIDDLYAEGRTYRRYLEEVKYLRHDTCFMTILMDGKAYNPKVTFSMRTNDWIVFPWEDFDAVTAGDRGLFREGTDVYGKD